MIFCLRCRRKLTVFVKPPCFYLSLSSEFRVSVNSAFRGRSLARSPPPNSPDSAASFSPPGRSPDGERRSSEKKESWTGKRGRGGSLLALGSNVSSRLATFSFLFSRIRAEKFLAVVIFDFLVLVSPPTKGDSGGSFGRCLFLDNR